MQIYVRQFNNDSHWWKTRLLNLTCLRSTLKAVSVSYRWEKLLLFAGEKYQKSTKNSLRRWEPETTNTTTFSKVIPLECVRVTARSFRLFGGSGRGEEVSEATVSPARSVSDGKEESEPQTGAHFPQGSSRVFSLWLFMVYLYAGLLTASPVMEFDWAGSGQVSR